MICLNCGRENQDGSAFCVYCGMEMTPPAAPVFSGQAFCTNCGAVLEPGFAFCTNCGAQQAPATAYVPEVPAAIPVPARKIELTPDRSAANPEMYRPRPVEPPKPLHSAFMAAPDLPSISGTPTAVPAPAVAPAPVAEPVFAEVPKTIVAPASVEVPKTIAVPEPAAAPIVIEPTVPAAPVFVEPSVPVVTEEMVFCTQCGTKIPVSCRHCTACGAPQIPDEPVVPAVPVMQEEEMVFCTQCGTRISASCRNCTACGAVQEPDEYLSPSPSADMTYVTEMPILSTSSAPAGKRKKSKKWLVVLISIVVGLAVLVGAAWFAVPAVTGQSVPELLGFAQDAEEGTEDQDAEEDRDSEA